jgi:hypothetical protein
VEPLGAPTDQQLACVRSAGEIDLPEQAKQIPLFQARQ